MWAIKIRAGKAWQSFPAGERVPRLSLSLLIAAPQEPAAAAKGCAGAGVASAGISLPQQGEKRECKAKKSSGCWAGNHSWRKTFPRFHTLLQGFFVFLGKTGKKMPP